MQKLLLIACILFCGKAALAQNTSGKIVYTETFKMNIDLGGDVDVKSDGAVNANEIRNMLPKEQKTKKVLYYTADAALFVVDKAKEKDKADDMERNEGGVRMVFRMDVPEDIVYTSIKDGKLIEQRDFMGRKFLVSSDIGKPKWKLTGKQKTILNYPCQEAVLVDGKDTISAWFTPAIPVSAGPQGFSGLPGMILEAKQNDQLVLEAEQVVPGGENSSLIIKPKEGKKVTKEQYRAIVEKKQKEMREENGGNGNVIIKINR